MKILVTGGLGSIDWFYIKLKQNNNEVYFCDLGHFNEKIIIDADCIYQSITKFI